MSIKRTELEILDMAINISRQHQSKINLLEKIESKNIVLEEPAEPKLKKGDTEGLKNYYNAKIHAKEINCGLEWERKKKMSLEQPNYNDSADRALYDELWKKKINNEPITKQEHDFMVSIYHQEEFSAGLDGLDFEQEEDENE